MEDQNLNGEKKDLYLENQIKIIEEMNSLKKEFQSKIKYDEQKEKTITKLHDELQIYKRDLYKKMLLPLINDLIHFTIRSEKDMEFLKDVPADKLQERMYDFLDDLRDILERQGVEPFKLDDDDFNPKKQKILKTIDTDKKELDKKVANHKFHGYEWDEKIIKHEMVELYTYIPNETDTPTPAYPVGIDNPTTHTEENIPTLQPNGFRPPNSSSVPLQEGELTNDETETENIDNQV